MTPLEPVILSFGAVLLLGLGFGAGPCNIACLPYLGPVFVATGDGVRNAWRILLPFSAGRIVGYSLLGGLSGFLGLIVQDWIAAPWVRWVLGGATIVVALSLLWRRRLRGAGCSVKQSTSVTVKMQPAKKKELTSTLPGGLFVMGMGMALNPCAPLTTVILAAATAGSAYAGLMLGVGFGVGAVLVPTFIFAFGVAHFGEQVKLHLSRWGRSLENASVALLILMGFGTAMGW
ncbi:MAG: sulfite exporter TauE/SafE family protein, partial [Sedimenticola sp.]|nr:sulfite exporter TauE/SafE family protein [Sedimenticola sp.]